MVVVLLLHFVVNIVVGCTTGEGENASMFSKINKFALVALILSLSVLSINAATVDPLLQTKLGTVAGDLIPAVVTYNAQPNAADLTSLRLLGVRYGVALKQLPMVGVWATGAQLQQIA